MLTAIVCALLFHHFYLAILLTSLDSSLHVHVSEICLLVVSFLYIFSCLRPIYKYNYSINYYSSFLLADEKLTSTELRSPDKTVLKEENK